MTLQKFKPEKQGGVVVLIYSQFLRGWNEDLHKYFDPKSKKKNSTRVNIMLNDIRGKILYFMTR